MLNWLCTSTTWPDKTLFPFLCIAVWLIGCRISIHYCFFLLSFCTKKKKKCFHPACQIVFPGLVMNAVLVFPLFCILRDPKNVLCGSGRLDTLCVRANPRRALLRFVPFVVPPHDESRNAGTRILFFFFFSKQRKEKPLPCPRTFRVMNWWSSHPTTRCRHFCHTWLPEAGKSYSDRRNRSSCCAELGCHMAW